MTSTDASATNCPYTGFVSRLGVANDQHRATSGGRRSSCLKELSDLSWNAARQPFLDGKRQRIKLTGMLDDGITETLCVAPTTRNRHDEVRENEDVRSQSFLVFP